MKLTLAAILDLGRKHGFTDAELPDLAAVVMTESGGWTDRVQGRPGGDLRPVPDLLGRGLVQIDLGQHPTVTEAEAFDPDFAMAFARRLSRNASGLGPTNWYGPRDHPDMAASARAGARELLDQEDPIDDTAPAELDQMATSHGQAASEAHPDGAWRTMATALLADRSATATVERALAFLEGQLGLAEYPPGSNVNWITDWYFGWHAAWCAMTVSRALIEAGFGNAERIDIPPLSTTSRKGWAYCPYVETDFRSAGRWHDGDPQPGDLVLYDWDGDGWSDHIGMLKEVAGDGSLYVYEGNTDEGVLRLKHRSRTYVRGFARPPFVAAPAVPNPHPQQEVEVALAIVPVHPGASVSIPLPQLDSAFGWSEVSITLTAGPDEATVRAVLGPDWRGLDPAHPEDLVIPSDGRVFTDLVGVTNVLQVTNYSDRQSVGVMVEAK